ncbi:MAG: amidohydrolase [Lachnospiraceae bacterium]|nr:amidohydrolase [Lachnospiraceae bacterium]
MKIRFYNARILSMNGNMDITPDSELWVFDDRISYIGKIKNDSDIIWDRQIDVKGNLLMPGFKDAHTHSGMTFLRSMADDLPLDRWLNEQIFPREAKLTGEDIKMCTMLAIMEYLSSGITAIFDMYLTPETIDEACIAGGMRCVQVGGMNNFSQSLKEQEEWYKKINAGNPLTSYMFGYHAEYTCSKELLMGLSDLAHKYSAPVFGHNSETASEVRGCIERYKMTPTQLADSLGLFDNGGGGYHCVFLSDEDIAIFRERGLSIVLNPGSNTKLASGIADIRRYLDEGIDLAIGTDGPASNNCLDMFREMFLVTGLSKLKEEDASVVDANDVLIMATKGGAKAMGLSDCDCLKEGKKADIIMIDLMSPNMQPLNNITKNIVYSGSKINVKMTMIDGVIRYEDREYNIGIEPEAVYSYVGDLADRLR